ncbi:MAG: DUF7144 family membrane protein [Solirubrobacteraceae bacterium]
MPTLTTNGASTKAPPTTDATLAYATEESQYRGAGWILFAGIMLAIAGSLNFIWGIAAVSSSHFFVANASFILSDLNTWGWIAIAFGAIEFLAALSIWRGGAFGRWFGIFVAGLAVIAAMMMIPAYPFWALTLVAIDLLVIYGLAAYGGKPELAP